MEDSQGTTEISNMICAFCIYAITVYKFSYEFSMHYVQDC